MRRTHRRTNRLNPKSLYHLRTIYERANERRIPCVIPDIRHLTDDQLAALANRKLTPNSHFPQALALALETS
jgi:hypothetical protein